MCTKLPLNEHLSNEDSAYVPARWKCVQNYLGNKDISLIRTLGPVLNCPNGVQNKAVPLDPENAVEKVNVHICQVHSIN